MNHVAALDCRVVQDPQIMVLASTGMVLNFGILALMAVLLVPLVMVVARYDLGRTTRDVALGVALGGVCAALILFSSGLPIGSVIDLRAAPAIVAGALGGPWSVVLVSLCGGMARLGVGGPFAVGGAVSLVLYATSALLVRQFLHRMLGERAGTWTFVPLSIVCTVCGIPGFFLGPDFESGLAALIAVFPTLLLWNPLGATVLAVALYFPWTAASAGRIADLNSELSERFGRLSQLDDLTGLLNRRGLRSAIASFQRAEQDAAVVIFDLDGLKRINDNFGHHVGDLVIRKTAARLLALVPHGAILARVGGDEFLTILPATSNVPDFCRAVLAKLSEPIPLPDNVLLVRASIGTASGRGSRLRSGELEQDADAALLEAKRRGGGVAVSFSEDMETARKERQQMQAELLAAIPREEIVPFYMAKVGRDGKLIGLEALARWHHPRMGLLEPPAFLGLASDLNVIDRLDAAILEQVVRDQKRWEDEGIEVPSVAVNVSRKRFSDPSLMDHLKRLRIANGKISFELLESIIFDDPDPLLAENAERLRQFGISLELDDFGSGHASMRALIDFHPDWIKVDRSISQAAQTSDRTRQLIKAIVEICQWLHLSALVEGIETEEQLARMKELGFDAFQGHLFGKACCAADMADWLKLKLPVVGHIGPLRCRSAEA